MNVPGARAARTRLLFSLVTVILVATRAVASAEHGHFEIADYFGVSRFPELALSADGRWLAYTVRRGSVANVTQVYVRMLAQESKPIAPKLLADARSIAWIAKTHELAFLSARTGRAQLYAYDVVSGNLRRITNAPDPVQRYAFSRDGKALAFLTRRAAEPATSPYQKLRGSGKGILLDVDAVSVYDFVNPDWGSSMSPASVDLWITRGGEAVQRVSVPGEVRDENASFSWSTDSQLLSVTYVPSDMPQSWTFPHTSLGIFDAAAGRFQILGHGAMPAAGRPGAAYSGGEWLPGGHELMVRRIVETTEPWVCQAFPLWAVVNAHVPFAEKKEAHWKTVEVYESGLRFIPLSRAQILVENTLDGVHSLYELRDSGVRRSETVARLSGSSSAFTFSADLRTVAFVNESLTRPPELYVKVGNAAPRPLTDLNGELARRIPYQAREVSWRGKDGLLIKGWLFEPDAAAGGEPWPMVTHVHGGPGLAMADTFMPYFSVWPYPFEVLASRGIAVFMPNYRGTMSYGRAVASPTRLDAEPADDILSGVESLVASGFADPRKLAITGHSHGGWLAPLVVTRNKQLFRAGSFAEGVTNLVLLYELMSGNLNRQIHDVLYGSSLWDRPQDYVAGSPELNFKDANTAMFFEAGAQSLAVAMLGLPKVARHFGMPAEFIVYPQTAHNPDLADIQRDSAQRNLDWFQFWLQGYEDPATDRVDQYRRWRELARAAGAAREFAMKTE